MIQIPDYFKKQQQEETQKKIKEAENKLNEFLEDEGLVLMPFMNPMIDRLVCSFKVVPKEFLKDKNIPKNKENEIIK